METMPSRLAIRSLQCCGKDLTKTETGNRGQSPSSLPGVETGTQLVCRPRLDDASEEEETKVSGWFSGYLEFFLTPFPDS